ncbi:carotenoid oxygenase family protein [Bacillus marinisedimentorum]|uniref:carotenoid oxygenase family protein n=1 Tax=Bacillus marinisedimentorum TaxID=1821260 RepID=UPI000872614E|nr:carotenoid oxygenase family protein [Bacillus marinisedimentorum]
MNKTDYNPYFTDMLYAPIDKEIAEEKLAVIEGQVPSDFSGAYVRNGPNPKYEPIGRHHWFDGDGMLHAVYIHEGNVSYRNRYIRTKGFQQEHAEQQPLWAGLMEDVSKNPDFEPLKNTSNTDVVFHNNNLLSLWYISGEPYRIDAKTLETIGVEDFGGQLKHHVSAHSKVDEKTGEFIFFDYGNTFPYMFYGVVSADGKSVHSVPVELPGPRLPHDMWITDNYSILMDLPLFNDPEALKKRRYKVKFFEEMPSRFGVIPRYGKTEDVRWFEADPCYIYHTINAWEEGDEIVLIGCRVREPEPPEIEGGSRIERMMQFLRLDSRLYSWRLNMKTGAVKEGMLCDMNTEFPVINSTYLGEKARYSYNVHIDASFTMKFNGLVKYDTWTGASKKFMFAPHQYGNEAAFAPRHNAQSEDDGYVVTYVYNEQTDQSELIILDARQFELGPVARIAIPQRVPMGFHATWIHGDHLYAE